MSHTSRFPGRGRPSIKPSEQTNRRPVQRADISIERHPRGHFCFESRHAEPDVSLPASPRPTGLIRVFVCLPAERASRRGGSAGTVEYRTGAKRREDMPRKPGTGAPGTSYDRPAERQTRRARTAPPQAAPQVDAGGRLLCLQLISDARDPSISYEIGWPEVVAAAHPVCPAIGISSCGSHDIGAPSSHLNQ